MNMLKYFQQLNEAADQYEAQIHEMLLDAPVRYGGVMQVNKVQEGTNMVLIRFLPPPPRRPPTFWSPDWCFYCICAGQHAEFSQDKGRNFEWHIGFLHASNNAKCGKGKYAQGILEILQCVEKQRPDFFVEKRGDARPHHDPRSSPWSYLNIFKRFYTTEFPVFSAKQVGKDLAWLVNATYPKFLNTFED